MTIDVPPTPAPPGVCFQTPPLTSVHPTPMIHCTKPPHGKDVPHSWETQT